jgi:hypothetical protein
MVVWVSHAGHGTMDIFNTTNSFSLVIDSNSFALTFLMTLSFIYPKMKTGLVF